MSPGQIPHERTASPFETAWNEFRGMIRGPLGCLAAILCLPFALLFLLVMIGVALWRGRKVRSALRDRAAGAPAPGDAVATADYVRMFASDKTFTRDEAMQAAVPVEGGRTALELLDDALRRGWIVECDGDGEVLTTARRTEWGGDGV